jgi:hypothetical protein
MEKITLEMKKLFTIPMNKLILTEAKLTVRSSMRKKIFEKLEGYD